MLTRITSILLITNKTEQCSSYCKQQIADLQRKLLELEQRMESFSRKISSNNTQLINRPSPFSRQPNFTSGGIRCYNCNLTGHVARHCRKAASVEIVEKAVTFLKTVARSALMPDETFETLTKS